MPRYAITITIETVIDAESKDEAYDEVDTWTVGEIADSGLITDIRAEQLFTDDTCDKEN